VLLPTEIPVMTLPNATLFPQALLPLYIFEPRYRQMLADVLQTNRMFSVAMQKPGCLREVPAPVAGLGVVRVSVGHRDGTSHLILQGIIRVELQETLRYKPYRVQRIRVLETPPVDNVNTDALVERVRELLTQRLTSSLPFLPFPTMAAKENDLESPCQCSEEVARTMLEHIRALRNPEHIADLVSCAVVRCPVRRQAILETTDIPARLRRLILFLTEEMEEHRLDES
jgi:Lon protease-like protein